MIFSCKVLNCTLTVPYMIVPIFPVKILIKYSKYWVNVGTKIYRTASIPTSLKLKLYVK